MQQLSLSLDVNPTLPRIRKHLIALYGRQRDAQRYDPTTQFIRAMLSSCTQDAVADAAFKRLCLAFSSWDEIADAAPALIVSAIEPVTYADAKAAHLVGALRIIRARRGCIELGFLAAWPVMDAITWLQRMPGVGPKIAAATLNFSTLRKRILTVDRHVLRTCKQLGILPRNADFQRGTRMLMRVIPSQWDADDFYELHWLLKMHGQRTCHATQPACYACMLASMCNYASVEQKPSAHRRSVRHIALHSDTFQF